MGYLKIIFYGLLAFIERNPKFCILLLLIAIFAPFVLRWVGWLLLIIVGVALLGLAFAILRFRKMQKNVEEQMRQTGGGFSGMGGFTNMGGFSNMGGANGMSLEELVRQMQAQADARKGQQQPKQSATTAKGVSGVDSADYVDFEEVE